MAKKPHPEPPDQSFPSTESLFRRVRKNETKRNGTIRVTAFGLPDMSVNREKYGTAEEARRGFDKADWGVAAFHVADIPPRTTWAHIAQTYRLLARHVPMTGNVAHAEIRVWRMVDGAFVPITDRTEDDFEAGDPDRQDRHGAAAALLDPDFHLRWRKHIALAAKMVLPCEDG